MRRPTPAQTFLIPILFFACNSAVVIAAQLEDGLVIDVTNSVNCTRKSQVADIVHVHYKGTLQDGTVFDESYKRKVPLAFELGSGKVIKGWDEGLLDMCIGEERRLNIPPALAYGNRAVGSIPAGSTLIFETKLMGIDGVVVEPPVSSIMLPAATSTLSDSAAPSVVVETDTATTKATVDVSSEKDEATSSSKDGPNPDPLPGAENGECRLLGPFALIVQAGLGLLALLSLVWKRYRERPRRPLKIWFFDASKQVFGSVLLHIANLFISMFFSGEYQITSKAKLLQDQTGHQTNPCSFYLINIAVDTTIGIPILVIFLRLLTHAASLTPLARPTESIKSGNYGQPPRATWWLKQSIIYFIGLLLMKLCVFGIFEILPWIAWAGDWALRWTEGSEALQIGFVMFVFPLIMNALQYYIIDSFIKDGSSGEHQPVSSDDEGQDEAREPLRDGEEYGDDFSSGHDSAEAETQKRIAASKELARSTPVKIRQNAADDGDDGVRSDSLGSNKGKEVEGRRHAP